MKVCIRLHKTSDRDLIVIANHFDIHKLIKTALISYSYGKPVVFSCNKTFDLSKEDIYERKITISITDPITQKVIGNIRKGSIGYFCKAVLRNSLNGYCLEAFSEAKKNKPGRFDDTDVVMLETYELLGQKLRRPKDVNNEISLKMPEDTEDVFLRAFNSIH